MKKASYPKSRYFKVSPHKLKELAEEDRRLLENFGAILHSVDPGLTVHLADFIETDEIDRKICPDWSILTLDSTTWWWIRPLLLELKKYREQQCLATNGSKEQ